MACCVVRSVLFGVFGLGEWETCVDGVLVGVGLWWLEMLGCLERVSKGELKICVGV